MHLIKGKEYPCYASVTMALIGGKWKTVILFHLIEKPLRYNELRKKMQTVTERTLSLQLKTLQEDGIIKRKVFSKKPPLKSRIFSNRIWKNTDSSFDIYS